MTDSESPPYCANCGTEQQCITAIDLHKRAADLLNSNGDIDDAELNAELAKRWCPFCEKYTKVANAVTFIRRTEND